MWYMGTRSPEPPESQGSTENSLGNTVPDVMAGLGLSHPQPRWSQQGPESLCLSAFCGRWVRGGVGGLTFWGSPVLAFCHPFFPLGLHPPPVAQKTKGL